MADEKKYTGYGYHGGGRKATGIKRVSICISGQPEQIEKLKEMAAQEEKTVSAFILEKTGANKKEGGIKWTSVWCAQICTSKRLQAETTA